MAQAIEALYGANVNLFYGDTGLKQGWPIFLFFFFICFSAYFKNQNIYLKQAVKVAKSNFKFASHQNLPTKDSLIKMALQAKLSLFAYVISGARSANRPKQLRNDAFHVKTCQSVKN